MKTKLIALGFVGVALTSACSEGSTAATSPEGEPLLSPTAAVQVDIADFAYSPAEVEVERGEQIVWTNKDDIAHTVTSGRPKKQGVPGVTSDRDAQPDGVFDSGTMELDDAFGFTADETGSFVYFCAIHAGMSARIVVR